MTSPHEWTELQKEEPPFRPGKYRVWNGETVVDAQWDGQRFRFEDGVTVDGVTHWRPHPDCLRNAIAKNA